jgi:hypothetical protein
MKYIRGPWVWNTVEGRSFWSPPEGYSGLDLRPIEKQSTQGGSPEVGLFAGDGEYSSDYDLLGVGSMRDIKASKKMRDAIPGKIRPKGDDLLGLIFDLLTDGADPDGIDGPKPLMPTGGTLELTFGNVRHCENFKWGDRRTAKVRDVLRRDFASAMDDSISGKMRDKEQHLRILDATCEKYGVDDWKEFVPVNRVKNIKGRVPHETTITDNFNKANSSTVGNLLTWTKVNNAWANNTNAAQYTTIGGSTNGFIRAESDLSSSDHYSQCVASNIGSSGTTNGGGAAARFASGASTFYYVFAYRFDSKLYLSKTVAGTDTTLTSATITIAPPQTFQIRCSGSSIKGYQEGVERVSTTDTAISGNTRGGIVSYQVMAGGAFFDDFEASDLAASGILYTQLERNTRGVNRGIYTRWGG